MNGSPPECFRDDRLLAHLDGELDAAETASVEAHLAECRSCADRYRSLTEADAEVRRQLTLLDEPAPVREAYDLTPRRSGRRLQLAAAASLILAVALTAGPLRGWVAGLLRGPEPEPAPILVEPVGPEVTEVRVTGVAVSVHFTAVPPGARLEIGRTDSDRRRFEDPTGDAAATVGTNQVEVSPGIDVDGATFRLSAPHGVTSIRLQGPTGPARLVNPNDLSGVIDLEAFFRGSDGA